MTLQTPGVGPPRLAQFFSRMEAQIKGVRRVTEPLVAIKGKNLVRIPRSAVVEATDGSKLPSFVEVIWKDEVYSVRRVDIEANTIQLAPV